MNPKGGSGRTTTAINLASAFARLGRRALLIDLDARSQCAHGLAVPAAQAGRGMDDLLLANPARPYPLDEVLWNVSRLFDFLPAGAALREVLGSDGPLSRTINPRHRLEEQLKSSQLPHEWCFIDLPAEGAMAHQIALQAADEVLVPIETGFMAHNLIGPFIASLCSETSGSSRTIRFLPTMHVPRSPLCADILRSLRSITGVDVCPTPIRFSLKLRECASLGQSIHEFAPASRSSREYLAAAHWLAEAPTCESPRAARRLTTDSYGDGASLPAVGIHQECRCVTHPEVTIVGGRAAEIAMRTRALRRRSDAASACARA